MDKQVIFNKAYLGLKGQGFQKALTEDGGGCLYRGVGNTKCAIGHLIPDEKYDPRFEKHGLSFGLSDPIIVEIFKAIEVEATEDNWNFLYNLQRCHDNSTFTHNMKNQLGHLALDHKLEVPV